MPEPMRAIHAPPQYWQYDYELKQWSPEPDLDLLWIAADITADFANNTIKVVYT